MMSSSHPILGIRSSSLTPQRTPLDGEMLRRVTDAGFAALELNFNHPGNELDYRDATLGARLAREAAHLSLMLTAHGVDELCLTTLDAEAWAANVAETRRFIHGISVYGARSLVLHVCGTIGRTDDAPERRRQALIDALTALAPDCEATGISLLVETMTPGRFTSSSANILSVIAAVGSPWVGMCLDTNHLNLSEDLPTAIRAAGPAIREFHLNDNHGEREEHLLPGDGAIDWPAVTTAIRDIDYTGLVIMEPVCPAEMEQNAWLAQAYNVCLNLDL